MLAFDLDGVLCPDINIDWHTNKFDIDELLAIRDKLPPIFHPHGKYFIITGRPTVDKPHTENWCAKYELFPNRIIYNEGDPNQLDKVCEHKAKALNNYFSTIDLYIESDPNQVRKIRQLTNVRVIHFAEFISKAIYENLY